MNRPPKSRGRKDNRYRGYNQGRDGDRRINGGDHGSYKSNSNNRRKSTTRHRVGFDGSDRSPESVGSRGDKSYQDFQEIKRWKEDNVSISLRSWNEEHDDE